MEELEALIEKITYANKDKVIQWRRYFHRHPELSFEEFDTADFIADRLVEMGYEIQRNIGGTGIAAVCDTGRLGPVIAFRADMDALPIFEETGLTFESENAGMMHACGHDCHMAILLGTAQAVLEMKEQLCGKIKFIFQPGEEANGGARCVIHDGALKNPDVSAIFALHMMPNLPTGTIGIKSGHLSATDDEFVIKIHGVSAHSSEPETGINAIMIAAHVITAMDSVLSNNVNPFNAATFSVCQIKGGEAINVIPEQVEMKGMIRCIESSDKEIIRKKIEKIVSYTAEAFGGSGEIDFIPGFPAVNNDEKLTETVIEAAEKMLDKPENICMIQRPHMGSEDFAYYQEAIPGVMFMLGCANEDSVTGTLHSCELNINEAALLVGTRMFCGIAARICKCSENHL